MLLVGCGWLVGWLAGWWFCGRRRRLVSPFESLDQALHAISGLGTHHQSSSSVQFASNSLQGFSELQLAGAGACWASPLGALGGRTVSEARSLGEWKDSLEWKGGFD